MKKNFLLFLLISGIANAQQSSEIKSNGSHNTMTVSQTGGNNAQKSKVDNVGDSNNVGVDQKQGMAQKTKNEKEKGEFIKGVDNTNTVVGLLISIATLIGVIWKGIPYIKKLKKNK